MHRIRCRNSLLKYLRVGKRWLPCQNLAMIIPRSCHDHTMIIAKHGHDHTMMTVRAAETFILNFRHYVVAAETFFLNSGHHVIAAETFFLNSCHQVVANFWARILCSLAAEDACFRMRITLGVVLIRSLVFQGCVAECSRNGSGVLPYLWVQEKFV